MIDRKDGSRFPVRAPIAASLAAALVACSMHAAAPPTANVPSGANVPDPPAPARESDLPEVIVTARAPQPGEPSNERIRQAEAGGPSVPAYTAKYRATTARKARVIRNSPDDPG